MTDFPGYGSSRKTIRGADSQTGSALFLIDCLVISHKLRYLCLEEENKRKYKTMRTSRFLPLFIIAAAIFTITAACSSDKKSDDKPAVVKDERIPGDSTFYGLACEGCTDSVVVVLPTDDSDPITFSIIDAMQSRQVFGRPKIGDQLAIVINKEDNRKADIVIDLDELKGTWVYQVMPKMRKMPHIAGMPKPKASPERDSMIQKLMVPIEQGFKIKKQFTMEPVGLRFKQTSLTGESPVEYPQAEYYKEWHVLNGRLVFTEGTIDTGSKKRRKLKPQKDTVEIVLMMKDSLQLKFKDGIKAYYRKK